MRFREILPILVLSLFLMGCGSDRPVESIQIKTVSKLEEAKSLLSNYAKGNPLGSEAVTFPRLIEEVKKENPERGAILEKGLNELQKMKGNIAGKAKELLTKL